MSPESDKNRGFLTSADKAYLRGEKDLSEGSEYNTKRRIRERTKEALRDFSVLFEHLAEEERRKIFETDSTGDVWREDPSLYDGARDALAFIFRSAKLTMAMQTMEARPDRLVADKLIEDAARRCGLKEDILVQNVSRLEFESVQVGSVFKHLKEGEDFPAPMLARVLETGALSEETVVELNSLIRSDMLDNKSE